jgi:hypothetical protein
MATFAAMEARIIAELHRDDVAAVVDDYINDAIAHYQRYRFWFNEASATQATVAGTETYNWPADFVELDSLVITVNATMYSLRQVAPRDIDEMYVNATHRGQPYSFANYKEQFRLYPTPDAVYTLTQYYLKDYTPLTTGSASSNVWTTEAEELIRTRAKKLLVGQFMPTSQDTAGWAGMLEQHEQNVLRGLQCQTQQSTRTGRLRRWDA